MSQSIYTYIKPDTLHHIVELLHDCSGLTIQVIQADGTVLEQIGEDYGYCCMFQKHLPEGGSCASFHLSAAMQSVEYGESYIFTCHANLDHIVFPIVSGKEFLGYVLLGPFLMNPADHILLSQTAEKYQLSVSDALELFDEAGQVPVISPEKATNAGNILYYLFSNLLEGSMNQLHFNNQRFAQQSQINESIQRYKGIPVSIRSYPYQKERQLVDSVQSGNTEQATSLLNELMGFVMAVDGGSMNVLRTRAFELCVLLSRVAIESGASSDSIFRINEDFYQELESIDTFDTLCIRIQELAQTFSQSILDQNYAQCSDAVKNAIAYIDQHFNEPITLPQVAEIVHLNSAYFSATFKQSIGYTFKEYLNMVRIEESKRLLANTNISIVDIAGACGFEGQSYFSKVFRKLTGVTPKQYRKI